MTDVEGYMCCSVMLGPRSVCMTGQDDDLLYMLLIVFFFNEIIGERGERS